MKFLQILSLFVLFSGVVFSQKPIVPLLETENLPVLKFRNEIKVGGFGEYIIAKKFLDDEDRLLTVTNFGIQFWNTKTAELIRSTPHEILNLEKLDSIITISPDGSKMIVTDGINISLSKLWGKKAKLPATVYSLETGKRLAVLQRPENSIRRGVWTEGGKTLVTFSSAFGQGYNMEISFWDGETFEFRGSISANKWNYLTRKGDKFITTSGVTKNTFGYKFEKPNAINIWNTQTGKIEKTYMLEKEKSLKNIRITDDERFLLSENDKHLILLNLETGAQQNFAAKDGTAVDSAQMSADKRFLAAENNGKILVWETNGNGLPKFEITPPAPIAKEKLTTDMLGFNFDSKHLAIWQMQYKRALLVFNIPNVVKTEFYDLETGKVNPDVNLYISRNSAVLSADEKYAITRNCDKATVAELTDMKELFIIPLKCKQYTTTTYENNETKTETHYYNDDIIAFHPRKNVSLVVKDEVLEIYGTNPEQKRLQSIFAPRMLKKEYSRGMFGNSIGDLFANVANLIEAYNIDPNYSSAGFLHDGDVVFATGYDSRSIFFWDVDKSLIE